MPKKAYSLDNIAPAGNSMHDHGSALYLPKIIQSLLSSTDKVSHSVNVRGLLVKSLEELLDLIKSFGGRLIFTRRSAFSFVWSDSYLDIIFNENNKMVTIDGFVSDPILLKIVSILETEFVSKEKKNLVFSIIRTSTGLEIHNMGEGFSPLIKENYLSEVIEDVDFVVKSFNKTPPVGRICILNGEPGTGKTYLIRSILSQMDCIFLIVPSNMVEALDKPDFVPLLLSIKAQHEKPIILIIEDGDLCLVPRKSDNMSTISSLLNLSDGIMGSMIDVKMIISTNAEIKEIDQAVTRPGRLCRNIYVGPLPYEQANTVYQRLMKDDSLTLEHRRSYTLAEVYDIVNSVDVSPPITSGTGGNRRVIGFTPSSKSADSRTLNSAPKIGFST